MKASHNGLSDSSDCKYDIDDSSVKDDDDDNIDDNDDSQDGCERGRRERDKVNSRV